MVGNIVFLGYRAKYLTMWNTLSRFVLVQLSRLLGAVNIEQHKQRSLDSLTLLAKSLRVGLNRSTKKL
jgi:hypothetical protein